MVCCRFYLTATPFAANPSGAVRATDVMVNNCSNYDRRPDFKDEYFLLSYVDIVYVEA